MKIAQHTNTLETNVQVKSRDFRIGNASKIIGILRNYLYEHKIRTAVQEYMSNARDAMREAKSSKRIIVTVPNQMNPVFKVRDFGPGITPERMEDVFLAYGNSTKESSNDEAGGFGIGAKSAWAYTDSFTIVSITDGRKRTYVAHTGVNNQGRLDEISNEPTTEATGAEIHVAVKSGDLLEFRNAIWRACHFWKAEEYPEFKGVVAHEVPQRKPSIRIDELELVTDLPSYLGLDNNHYHDYVSMVIDGIPYKMDKQFIRGIDELTYLLAPIKCNALIHVGNGVLEIPATRESVAGTDLNKEILSKLAPKLLKGLEKYIKAEFAKAKTYPEWIKTYHELNRLFDSEEHSKRGDYFIANGGIGSKLFKDFSVWEAGPNFGRRSRGGFKRVDISVIDLNHLNHIFFVDNPDEFMVTQNRRVKEYLEKSGAKKAILFAPKESFEMVPNTSKNVTTAPVAGQTTPGPVTLPTDLIRKVTVTLAESEKTMQKVLKDLGGNALSTLPYTPIVREKRELRVKEKEEFTIHKYRGWNRKNPRATTLEKVEASSDKYLYIPFKEFGKYHAEFKEMREFVESLGWELCCLAPKTVKLVSGSKSFRHYDNWRDTYKPDTKLVASYCSKKAKNKKEMQLLSQATEKIADLALVEMLAVYGAILKSNPQDVPATIEDMISKEVKAFEKDDAELTKLLKESYPLLSVIEGNRTATANEAVFYVNAKA